MKKDKNEFEYPENTIGYHWQMANAIFGPESPATKWLVAKAKESPGGMNERVVQDESQVVYMLCQLHHGDKSAGESE